MCLSRIRAVASAIISLLAVATTMTSVSTPATAFGSINSTSPPPHGAPFAEYPITDIYAQQVALRVAGPRVASRMLTRVTKPIGVRADTYWYVEKTSSNWAGWVADVNGQPLISEGANGYFWNESSCYLFCSTVGSWVGVGGFNGTNLIQTGVDQRLNQTWYELYPNPPVYQFGVNNNDELYGDVHFDFGTGRWYILIDDLSTGQYYSSEFSFNPDQTSSEWITEDVNSGSVPSFSPVNFRTGIWIDSNGNNQPIASSENSTLWKVDLVASCGSITPSQLDSTGESFINSPTPC